MTSWPTFTDDEIYQLQSNDVNYNHLDAVHSGSQHSRLPHGGEIETLQETLKLLGVKNLTQIEILMLAVYL